MEYYCVMYYGLFGFNQFSTDRHWDCFQYSAITNNTTINNCVYVCTIFYLFLHSLPPLFFLVKIVKWKYTIKYYQLCKLNIIKSFPQEFYHFIFLSEIDDNYYFPMTNPAIIKLEFLPIRWWQMGTQISFNLYFSGTSWPPFQMFENHFYFFFFELPVHICLYIYIRLFFFFLHF